jgi:hypothetical protein
MGDYTDLTLKVKLKADTPESVIDLIKSPLANIDQTKSVDDIVVSERAKFPEHDLFNESRCFFLLGERQKQDDDKRFLSLVKVENGEWLLECHRTIKNYESEIELFLDWLAPYVLPQIECGTYKEHERNIQQISFNDSFEISEPEPDADDDWGFGFPSKT